MPTSLFAKLRELPFIEQRSVAAAAVTLSVVWIRLHWLGLAAVQRWVAGFRPRSTPIPSPENVRRIASLVGATARHLPFPSTCLTRSIALVLMLKKQGIESQLRIGVRKEGAALAAHAWVEFAGVPVNDTLDVAQRFAMFSEPLPLSAFPTQ
jgi:hypothetical protein